MVIAKLVALLLLTTVAASAMDYRAEAKRIEAEATKLETKKDATAREKQRAADMRLKFYSEWLAVADLRHLDTTEEIPPGASAAEADAVRARNTLHAHINDCISEADLAKKLLAKHGDSPETKADMERCYIPRIRVLLVGDEKRPGSDKWWAEYHKQRPAARGAERLALDR